MTQTRQKRAEADAESQTAIFTTRTVAGNDIAIVQSHSAALACVRSGPKTVVLDLQEISVSERRFVTWFLNMAGDSSRILLTGRDDLPVDPIRIDGVIEKPLNDEKLQKFLTEFDFREQYARALSEYMDCVCNSGSTISGDRLQELRSELIELRETLKNLDEASAVSAFDRTMREILLRECNP